jgi:hypothetical protein
MPHLRPTRPSLLARTTALLAVLVVLALTVLVASPELHERLHAHDPGGAPASSAHRTGADDDGGCVVTLFAQGVVAALLYLCLAFTGQSVGTERLASWDGILPEAPPFLFLPTQAPPSLRS